VVSQRRNASFSLALNRPRHVELFSRAGTGDQPHFRHSPLGLPVENAESWSRLKGTSEIVAAWTTTPDGPFERGVVSQRRNASFSLALNRPQQKDLDLFGCLR